jgi:hypothetical protein
VGSPKENAGTDGKPLRATGFSAFAVTAAPAAVVSRKRVFRFIRR